MTIVTTTPTQDSRSLYDVLYCLGKDGSKDLVKLQLMVLLYFTF